MARRNSILLGMAIVVAVILIALPAQAQIARQAGTVLDDQGNPIGGIEVQLDKIIQAAGDMHLTEKTNAEGRFVFSGMSGGRWRLTVQAEGFEPFSQVFMISSLDRNADLEVVLKKIDLSSMGGDARGEAEAVITEGKQLIAEEKYDEAIALYNQFYEKWPQAVMVKIFVGDALMAKGEKEAAIDAYLELLDAEPENAQALKRIGDIYVKDYDYVGAMDYYVRLADLTKDNAEIQFIAAQVANGASNYEKAIELFERFLALEPGSSKSAEALMTVGYLYSTNGDCDKAEESFNKFNTLVPGSGMEGEFAAEVERCKKK